MTLNQTLGLAIQNARKARGWTQTQLAEHSGVHLNTVSAVERGQADPRLSSLTALFAPLGLHLHALPVEWPREVLSPFTHSTPMRPGALAAPSASGAAASNVAALKGEQRALAELDLPAFLRKRAD